MSKRLSKISRELHIGISTIVAFLNSNGYKCDEDPSEMLPEEIIEFLTNNIESYLRESGEDAFVESVPKETSKKILKTIENVPLELKIIDAANKKKKLVERIIGFTDFDWHYTVVKFKGVCSQPVKFTLFDEVICKLLQIEQMSLSQIGAILGFNVDCDPAEKHILILAMRELIKDKMIEGDESVYWLTDLGRQYAIDGVKFTSYTRTFELYIDAIADVKENAKSIFSGLVSEKQSSFKRDNLPNNIEDVKPIAEYQAPEIHFPRNNYILQSCEVAGRPEGFVGKVWVVLLENFKTNDYRILVYDDKSGRIIDELSNAISKVETQKQLILDKLIQESALDESPVLPTDEVKNEEQIKEEGILIAKQEEIDQAIADNDENKAEEIKNEHVFSKRHFNSIEFEIELKRLFEETRGELWIISPWIKRATFKRIPFIESYLKKGGRVFIAFSEPEKEGVVMAETEPYEKLLELEKKYHNFYIAQTPIFHYKRVWLREDEINLYYTGSYNILSFYVSQGMQNFRQEDMTKLIWNKDDDDEYLTLLKHFAQKYFNQTIEEFNQICNPSQPVDRAFLKVLNLYSFSKLKPFLGHGIMGLDDKYDEIIESKEEHLKYFRDQFYQSEIQKLHEDAEKLDNSLASYDKKKSIQSRLNVLDNEFPEKSSHQSRLDVIAMLSKMRTIKPETFKTNKFNKKKYK
ncbi:MAG: hypothetical protein IJV81_08255 [Paludibacteraceae bacterium]|nr:hypothetical protein [Paludibacteraceae bacterium]